MATFEINSKGYDLEFTLGAFRDQAKDVKKNNLEGIEASMSLIKAARKYAAKRAEEPFGKKEVSDMDNDLDLASMAEITAINTYVVELTKEEDQEGEGPN